MADLSSLLESFGVLLVVMIFFKKIFSNKIFDFGLLWSIRSRFRLRSSSFYIFVDLYLTKFLSYVSVQILGTNLQCGRGR